MHAVIPYVTAALLFGLGVYGVLRRRNAVLVLMAVELMLNAVNLILVTADAPVRSALVGVQVEAWANAGGDPQSGGVFALFVIVLAAAEIGVGLAIVLQYFRMRANVALDEVPLDAASLDAVPLDAASLDAASLDAVPLDAAPERPAGDRVTG